MLGQPDATLAQLKLSSNNVFLPLYGQKNCAIMNKARARFYLSRPKPPLLKKLPPTDVNLQLHVLQAHLQMQLWKAADQCHPPAESQDITKFGWSIEESIVTPVISRAAVAPQALLDVVSCSCTAEGKACSSARCSCNSAQLSCTDYCKCGGGFACCSPFSDKQADIEGDDDELDVQEDV